MQWYYSDGNEAVGPMSELDMLALLKEGVIDRTTLVWNETMQNWACIENTALADSNLSRREVLLSATPSEPDAVEPCSFFSKAPEAFLFPFKGRGKILLVIGWLFFWCVQFSSRIGGLLGFAVGGLFAGYLCAYLMKIIAATAVGEDEMPDWPSMSHGWSEIMSPFFMVIVGTLACFLPMVALAIVWWKTGFFNRYLLVEFLALGLFVQPMVFLCIALHNAWSGLNPRVIFHAIYKTFFPYLFVCFIWVSSMMVRFVGLALWSNVAAPIVISLVWQLLSFYFMIVEMRLLGMLFRCYEDRLRWFDFE